MKNKNLVVAILFLIIVGAGSFFAGIKYQQGRGNFSNRNFGSQGINQRQFNQGGMANNRGGFRPVSGEIISADDKSITIKLTDGSSKIVFLNDQTEINKASQAVKEDLKVGEKVMAMGQENSDGSITAQNIQLNPLFRGNQPVTP